MTIKEIKKTLGITNKEIADMFGYSNLQSYQNSSGKIKIEQGLEIFYKLVKTKSAKNPVVIRGDFELSEL